MRIIAGENKGRRLVAPKGTETRPTADRVREAVFNVLAPYIEGSSVLDVFAGTGAFSLEALSRGARRALLIDRAKAAQAAIERNIAACGCAGRAVLCRGDSLQILPRLEENFDIIFLDPPYAKDLLFPAISIILNNKLLTDDGIIVMETAADAELGSLPLDIRKQSVYGDTKITYCVKRR